MKLVIVDMDGTLFDTKDVNYHAYKDAIAPYGYSIDYKYYCDYCNGRHYMDFLPQITTNDNEVLQAMHSAKKVAYKKHLDKAVLNDGLVDIVRLMRAEYKTAVVTTASKENCYDILNQFELVDLFDLILTHDDITKSKPDPEGFLCAMKHFDAKPSETIIFEDSEVGLEAGLKEVEHTIIRHIDLIESGIIKDYTDDKGSGSSNSNDTNLVSLFFIPYIGFISIINVWLVIFSLLGTVMDQKNMDGLCMLSRFIKRSL